MSKRFIEILESNLNDRDKIKKLKILFSREIKEFEKEQEEIYIPAAIQDFDPTGIFD